MRVFLESSHAHAETDYADGLLSILIAWEDEGAGQTFYDEISFSIPRDFHTHNDLVAAALMTLIGRSSPAVSFNFPISRICADTLSVHYNLTEIGPVDPALDPRQRGRERGDGRYLGLNFSGGLDSTAVLCLLQHIGAEFKVITSDYGYGFRHERSVYERFPRDLTCTTDLRTKRYDRKGRFNFAVPLLYADYLNLYGITTGHMFHHGPPLSMESLDRGQVPRFRAQDRVVNAGGLEEIHLIRGLTGLGTIKLLLALRPDLVEAAFRAVGRPEQEKYFSKAMMARWLCERMGRPIPGYLTSLDFPPPGPPFSHPQTDAFRLLFFAKHYGTDFVERIAPGISLLDMSILDELTLDFYAKYNPNYLSLLPDDLRNPIIDTLHRCDIYPYDEHDFRELAQVRDLLSLG